MNYDLHSRKYLLFLLLKQEACFDTERLFNLLVLNTKIGGLAHLARALRWQ